MDGKKHTSTTMVKFGNLSFPQSGPFIVIQHEEQVGFQILMFNFRTEKGFAFSKIVKLAKYI